MQKLIPWVFVLILTAGCTFEPLRRPSPSPSVGIQTNVLPQIRPQQSPVVDTGWTERTISDDELYRLSDEDPELTPVRCREILARLNGKASYLVSEDIGKGRRLKVPNDFRAFKEWTPMPDSISKLTDLPRCIVILKDIPFLGWYEWGKLVGDSHVCLGREGQETSSGRFRVEQKDADHYSRSYQNAYGEPAWMPWALRIYDHVWIHAGDVTGPFCSPGCVVLPLGKAQELFMWADLGTPVLILDSKQNQAF